MSALSTVVSSPSAPSVFASSFSAALSTAGSLVVGGVLVGTLSGRGRGGSSLFLVHLRKGTVSCRRHFHVGAKAFVDSAIEKESAEEQFLKD